MPKLDKAKRRDKARHKAKHGHKTSGRSVFLIQEIQIKKSEEVKKKKEKPLDK